MLYNVVGQTSEACCHARAEVTFTQPDKAVVICGVVAVNQEGGIPDKDAL